MVKYVALFFTLLLFSGCFGIGATHTHKPSWINNPNQGSSRGAVGVSSRTYDQRVSTQRTLAISRALDELSLQQGVQVTLSMQRDERVENDRARSKMHTQSGYEATSTVTAHIADIYTDPISGELYVWMVLD